MPRKQSEFTYTFIDPNTPQEVENALKAILIDKLLSLHINEPLEIPSQSIPKNA